MLPTSIQIELQFDSVRDTFNSALHSTDGCYVNLRPPRSILLVAALCAVISAALVAVPLTASFASAATPTVTGAAPVAADAARIDAYLMTKASPMVGQGAAFIASGGAWKIDPRLLVAISGAESNFGQITCAPFNAWGYGCPNGPYRFTSWADGIDTVAKGLRTNYLSEGRTSVALINLKYAPIGAANDPTGLNNNWTINVSKFLTELGGDPAHIDIAGIAGALPVGPEVDHSAAGLNFSPAVNPTKPVRVSAGMPVSMMIALTNSGSAPWGAQDVRLRRIDTEGRVGSAPIAALQESSVLPGAVAHFRVALSALGAHSGTATTEWRLEGAAGPAGDEIKRAVRFDVPAFAVGEMRTDVRSGSNGITTVFVRAQNAGSADWDRTGSVSVALGSRGVSAGIEPVKWSAPEAPARLLERTVHPGEWGSFAFRVHVLPGADRQMRVALFTTQGWVAGDDLPIRFP